MPRDVPMFEVLYTLDAINGKGKTFDKARAENAVAQMIRMLTQKDSGEHLKRDKTSEITGLPIKLNAERVTWELLHQAISLYMKRQNPKAW